MALEEGWLQRIFQSENLKNFTMTLRRREETDFRLMYVDVTGEDEKGNEQKFHCFVKYHMDVFSYFTEDPKPKEYFANERYWYDTIYPSFLEFQRAKGVDTPFDNVPKCYGTILEENSFVLTQRVIVLEDVKATDHVLWSSRRPLSRKHLEIVLEAYAKLHATSAAMQKQQPKEFEKIVNTVRQLEHQRKDALKVKDKCAQYEPNLVRLFHYLDLNRNVKSPEKKEVVPPGPSVETHEKVKEVVAKSPTAETNGEIEVKVVQSPTAETNGEIEVEVVQSPTAETNGEIEEEMAQSPPAETNGEIEEEAAQSPPAETHEKMEEEATQSPPAETHEKVEKDVPQSPTAQPHEKMEEEVAQSPPAETHEKVEEDVPQSPTAQTQEKMEEEVAQSPPVETHEKVEEDVPQSPTAETHEKMKEEVAQSPPAETHKKVEQDVPQSPPAETHEKMEEEVAQGPPAVAPKDPSPSMRVILHGDCWTNNFLSKFSDPNDKEMPTDLVIVDWQMIKYGSPIYDVSGFLFTFVSEQDIEHLPAMLVCYYECFCVHLKKLGIRDTDAFYPYEQFKEEWKRFSKYGFISSYHGLVEGNVGGGATNDIYYDAPMVMRKLKRVVDYLRQRDLMQM